MVERKNYRMSINGKVIGVSDDPLAFAFGYMQGQRKQARAKNSRKDPLAPAYIQGYNSGWRR